MKTRILITVGDINGIGPEIILKTFLNDAFTKKYDLTVVSPFSVLSYYAKLYRINLSMDNFHILPVGSEKVKITPGRITEDAGFLSGLAIEMAVTLCKEGEFDAIVTAPINKKALNLGGFNHDGHTEMLTALDKAKDTCMVMLSDKFNIGFATTHPPLKNVAGMITKKLLTAKMETCYRTMKADLGYTNPKMGVLGLNPHAGDNGLIGDEETKIIEPAIKAAAQNHKDLKVTGPHSPDAYFASGKYKSFDMTLAMYHDQGFIPFKMLAGHYGTNFTSGLSFVRTSPDHGTAFDITGKNLASEVSLVEAIKWADKIFRNRTKNKK